MKLELNLAKKAATDAGSIILQYFQSDYDIKEKGFHNPVTTADIKANDFLQDFLLSSSPNCGWLSEETVDRKERLKKEKVWIIDPIDGTKEFIKGTSQFVVSIGLVENGYPVVGVIYNPITKEIFYGAKGLGAFYNDKQIFCNQIELCIDMKVLNSRSESKRGLWDNYKDKFKELRPIGSVAYKLGLVAAGYGDIFATLRPKNEWDICAGNCIINEAKGRLIDLNGNERKYNLEDTLIFPGMLAGSLIGIDKVLQIIKY